MKDLVGVGVVGSPYLYLSASRWVPWQLGYLSSASHDFQDFPMWPLFPKYNEGSKVRCTGVLHASTG